MDLMSLLVSEGGDDVMGETYDFQTLVDGDCVLGGPVRLQARSR